MSRSIFKVVLAVFFMLLSVDAGRAEMTIKITSPTDGAYFEPCSDIPLSCEITTTAGEEIRSVRYYYDGLLIPGGNIRSAPWDGVWAQVVSDHYELTARVEDMDRNQVFTEESISITVGGISRGDVLKNGSFDCGKMTPWSLQNNEGAVSTAQVYTDFYFEDSTYIFLDIENGASADWHIQLHQTLPVDSGHTYEAWFYGDADEIKTIAVGIQQNVDPWTSYMWESAEIDGFNDYGPFILDAITTDHQAQFKLCCGGNDINCYFDNIRVLDKSITSVKSIELAFDGGAALEYELYQNYPNPFNAQTELQYRLSTSAFVDLAIYNVQGRLVKNLLNEKKPEGTHRIVWDGTDVTHSPVPSGVYFYRMQARTGDRTIDLSRKLLLLK